MDQIGFGIKTVKETEFYANESLALDTQIDLVTNAGLDIRIEENEIHLFVSAVYKRKGTGEEYMRGKTISIFLFENLKSRERVKDGKSAIDLPDPLWVTLFSISYSHARAMLAKSAAGTKFGQMILPLVDPEEHFKNIFKKELEGQVFESSKRSELNPKKV